MRKKIFQAMMAAAGSVLLASLIIILGCLYDYFGGLQEKQMQDELNTIVDFGGVVLDVIVRHEVYGELRAELNISSRNKVALFMEEIRQGKSRPLKNITSGEHFHTVSADSAQTLDLIEEELRKKDYLVRTVK